MVNGNRFRIGMVLAALGGGWIALCVLGSAGAAEKETDRPARIAPVKHLMSGINNPNCSAIAQLLKESGPADDQAWEKVAMHASVLNEAGHLLMQNDRCPDGVWASATAKLREGSSAVHAAAVKKDLPAARDAFKVATASCGACHAVHKDKKPEVKAERVARIDTLMRVINKPHCGKVGELIKGDGPADDKAWTTLIDSASMLNEVSYALMDDKRCPDATWKEACEQLRLASTEITVAARAKDLETIRKAFKEVTGSCSTCHAVHKKPKI